MNSTTPSKLTLSPYRMIAAGVLLLFALYMLFSGMADAFIFKVGFAIVSIGYGVVVCMNQNPKLKTTISVILLVFSLIYACFLLIYVFEINVYSTTIEDLAYAFILGIFSFPFFIVCRIDEEGLKKNMHPDPRSWVIGYLTGQFFLGIFLLLIFLLLSYMGGGGSLEWISSDIMPILVIECIILLLVYILLSVELLLKHREKLKITAFQVVTAFLALLLCVACVVIPLFVNVLKATSYTDEVTLRGVNVMQSILFGSEELPKFDELKDVLLSNTPIINETLLFLELEDGYIQLLTVTLIVAIWILVLGAVLAAKASDNLEGKSYTLISIIVAMASLLVFAGLSIMLSKTIDSYFGSGYLGIEVSTGVIVPVVLGILIGALYFVVCIPQCRAKLEAIKIFGASPATAQSEASAYGNSSAVPFFRKRGEPISSVSNEEARIELLMKYKKLLDDGVITEEEFQKKKESLLNVTTIAPADDGAVAGAAADPAAEEKTEFDVVLAFAGDKKLNVIKVVRELTGLGLKDAKDLVESVPQAIKEGVSKDEADKIKAQLEEAGATVELK